MLWSYWEVVWLPKLDEGLGPDDLKMKTRLSAVGWLLRIVEDDREPDEGFRSTLRSMNCFPFNVLICLAS